MSKELYGFDDDDFDGDCPDCGGEGFIEADCDEDTCCCAEPHDLIPCPTCRLNRPLIINDLQIVIKEKS